MIYKLKRYYFYQSDFMLTPLELQNKIEEPKYIRKALRLKEDIHDFLSNLGIGNIYRVDRMATVNNKKYYSFYSVTNTLEPRDFRLLYLN